MIVSCAEAGVSGYHLRSESLEDLRTLILRVADGESVFTAGLRDVAPSFL